MKKYSEKMLKKAGKKTFKTGSKLAIKLIGFIGVPVFLALICLMVLIAGISSQIEKEVSAISVLDKKDNSVITEELSKGKATYVGVDDTDTELSKAVLAQLSKYSNSYNPYYHGYTNLCQKFCGDIYRQAGISYKGTCCAYNHSLIAKKTGKIPKGALVFSGQKPDGSFYENNHAAGCFCPVCNNWAGHIGIYAGNGIIVGSQIPYAMSVDTWIEMCGYGGYSTY